MEKPEALQIAPNDSINHSDVNPYRTPLLWHNIKSSQIQLNFHINACKTLFSSRNFQVLKGKIGKGSVRINLKKIQVDYESLRHADPEFYRIE